MVYDPTTRDYIDRRIKEGLTKKEAIRCLKRYIAARSTTTYHAHNSPLTAPRSIDMGHSLQDSVLASRALQSSVPPLGATSCSARRKSWRQRSSIAA